jgi:hypothetical protein
VSTRGARSAYRRAGRGSLGAPGNSQSAAFDRRPARGDCQSARPDICDPQCRGHLSWPACRCLIRSLESETSFRSASMGNARRSNRSAAGVPGFVPLDLFEGLTVFGLGTNWTDYFFRHDTVFGSMRSDSAWVPMNFTSTRLPPFVGLPGARSCCRWQDRNISRSNTAHHHQPGRHFKRYRRQVIGQTVGLRDDVIQRYRSLQETASIPLLPAVRSRARPCRCGSGSGCTKSHDPSFSRRDVRDAERKPGSSQDPSSR